MCGMSWRRRRKTLHFSCMTFVQKKETDWLSMQEIEWFLATRCKTSSLSLSCFTPFQDIQRKGPSNLVMFDTENGDEWAGFQNTFLHTNFLQRNMRQRRWYFREHSRLNHTLSTCILYFFFSFPTILQRTVKTLTLVIMTGCIVQSKQQGSQEDLFEKSPIP